MIISPALRSVFAALTVSCSLSTVQAADVLPPEPKAYLLGIDQALNENGLGHLMMYPGETASGASFAAGVECVATMRQNGRVAAYGKFGPSKVTGVAANTCAKNVFRHAHIIDGQKQYLLMPEAVRNLQLQCNQLRPSNVAC